MDRRKNELEFESFVPVKWQTPW